MNATGPAYGSAKLTPLDEASPVWTVGHSTRTWEAFREVLRVHEITTVVDVRRFPGSRKFPWFGSDAMSTQLPLDGIGYHWVPQLGGRRSVQPESPNGAWKSASFQGYADHMASAEFADGLEQALTAAAESRTALMCAELLWWRCHRRLISDLLVHRGHQVLHIQTERAAEPHQLNPMAQAAGEGLIYPPLQLGLL
ncbi:DUF488 domain-containing protein [Stenotrophomonas sp.]|uniref:DUF488 domain-containing protein n=1 Tax=Stenotrophomonas sp. TaxID=69392 RepID=UPI0028B267B4|nr:DUF488 domain-containing protein [Stenotrophomonas sp.]